MLTDQNCDEVRCAQLQQSVDQIATLLQESSSQVAWLAESILTFQTSCALTNGNEYGRQVNPDIVRCDLVAKCAQYWMLITARRVNLNTKRWYQAMLTALAEIKVPLPDVEEDASSYLGLQYEYARHAGLFSGQYCCNYSTLLAQPQQRLIAMMSLEDNEHFMQNRYRYETHKLGLTAGADEHAVLRTLHEHA